MDPAAAAPSRSIRETGLIVASGAAMSLLFLLVRESLTDDAYITLAYAKNLALDLHWGLIPQEVANTATSPLNTVLIAAGAAVTRIGGGVHPVLALGAISVGLAMLMAWGWVRVIRALRLPFATAVLGVALVLVNPFLLSAVGLEVLMVPTAMILLLAMALEGRPGWFGVVAGFALLTRLDLAVFVVLVAVATPAIRRGFVRALGAMAAVATPWFAFSWVYLGSAVPDTLLIKLNQPAWGEWSYVDGPLLYFREQRIEVSLALLPALLGVVALGGWLVARRSRQWTAPGVAALGPAAALGFGALAYYAAYSLMAVGPYHWYYVAPIAGLTIWLAIAIGALFRAGHAGTRLRGAAAAAVGVAGLLALGNVAVDVGQGVPWRSPVIFTNWATAKDYARVGSALPKRVGRAGVQSPGEIGELAYFCECTIVDEFSDRGRAMEVLNQRIDSGSSVARLLLKANYAWADRSEEPIRADYHLRYVPGPGTGRDVWQVSSPWRGVGHFALTPASDTAP